MSKVFDVLGRTIVIRWLAHLTMRQWFRSSTVKDSSVIAVQIFDQRKFKRRDQGFLGVVNIPVRDHLDMDVGGQGQSLAPITSQCPSIALKYGADFVLLFSQRCSHSISKSRTTI